VGVEDEVRLSEVSAQWQLALAASEEVHLEEVRGGAALLHRAECPFGSGMSTTTKKVLDIVNGRCGEMASCCFDRESSVSWIAHAVSMTRRMRAAEHVVLGSDLLSSQTHQIKRLKQEIPGLDALLGRWGGLVEAHDERRTRWLDAHGTSLVRATALLGELHAGDLESPEVIRLEAALHDPAGPRPGLVGRGLGAELVTLLDGAAQEGRVCAHAPDGVAGLLGGLEADALVEMGLAGSFLVLPRDLAGLVNWCGAEGELEVLEEGDDAEVLETTERLVADGTSLQEALATARALR
jgi:hypothetical protein